MTNDEKIAKGLCTANTNAETGEVTIIPYTDEEIANIQEPVVVEPIKEDLLAQLADLQAKINAL